MSLAQTMISGMRAVLTNRFRSLLTSLGILIGVGALIVTVGIGTGTRSSIGKGLTRLGTNLITVLPGAITTNGVSQGLGAQTTLTMDDARALSDQTVAPDILAVAPLVVHSKAIMQAGAHSWTTTVAGSNSSVLIAYARSISEGAAFSDADVAGSVHVAILGQTTADQLFPGQDAVGRQFQIQHVPFRVVGVLTVVGATGQFNPDDIVIVPITTAQESFNLGAGVVGHQLTSVQAISISAVSRDAIDSAKDEVTQLLLQTQHITDPAQADFKITTQQQILNTLDATSASLTLLLAGVAGVALLVGGIGVMNIMLVSVTERVGEIGLRKAVGATQADILRQFLIEAACLSAGGGLLGVALGAAATYALDHYTGMATVFIPGVAVIGVVISAAIGLVFGVLPAIRAARLAPIEALRAA
jgi:putative ABC transport system permease protein